VQRRDVPESPQPASEPDLEPRFGDGDGPAPIGGLDRLVRVDVILTGVFVASAVFAAVVFNDAARVVGVVVALTLFAVGTFAFLMGYFVAVGRSRTEEMSVTELYLLAGKALPAAPKRLLLWALGVQIVTALATAIARSSTDGKAGSTLAFGVMVPMLGLGINGLASARYGTFGPRRRRGDLIEADEVDDDLTDDPDEIDEPHIDAPSGSTERDDVPPPNHD
jgi:hypothetical protein